MTDSDTLRPSAAIKRALRAQWPGTAFSVCATSRRIKWVDGPKPSAVDDVVPTTSIRGIFLNRTYTTGFATLYYLRRKRAGQSLVEHRSGNSSFVSFSGDELDGTSITDEERLWIEVFLRLDGRQVDRPFDWDLTRLATAVDSYFDTVNAILAPAVAAR